MLTCICKVIVSRMSVGGASQKKELQILSRQCTYTLMKVS